jgi:Protein of unknown function (DUF3300)
MKRLATFALCATLLTGGAALAQAPIVRQAPPPPPDQTQAPASPDQQQAQPAYSQQYPQQSQPQYPQGQYPQSGAPQSQYPPQQGQYPPQAQYPQQGQPQYPQQAPEQGPPPAPLPPQRLDQMVQRIALYPDPLLAQILTATTFYDQIPEAAGWAQQHSYLTGDALSGAIAADNLPWDPSVLALLPFPSVLDMMARDPQWTGTLGNAVLVQRNDVMDAVQRQRRAAQSYGYLAPNAYDNVVDNGGYVEIQPVNPAYLYVPVYNPGVVFFAPRPGFFVGGAVVFGPRVFLSPGFATFGWFGAGFGWGGHAILIDHRPWGRTYWNRGVYVHPYAHPFVHGGARFEGHAFDHGGYHGHDYHR